MSSYFVMVGRLWLGFCYVGNTIGLGMALAPYGWQLQVFLSWGGMLPMLDIRVRRSG